jgi:hypothetical protein
MPKWPSGKPTLAGRDRPPARKGDPPGAAGRPGTDPGLVRSPPRENPGHLERANQPRSYPYNRDRYRGMSGHLGAARHGSARRTNCRPCAAEERRDGLGSLGSYRATVGRPADSATAAVTVSPPPAQTNIRGFCRFHRGWAANTVGRLQVALSSAKLLRFGRWRMASPLLIYGRRGNDTKSGERREALPGRATGAHLASWIRCSPVKDLVAFTGCRRS